MSILTSYSSPTASQIAAARQVEFVAFLHRHPSALDRFRLGYLLGFQKDCGYQADQYRDLTLPVGMLDNDFQNPDVEQFVDHFFDDEPHVGVIGGIYEPADVEL